MTQILRNATTGLPLEIQGYAVIFAERSTSWSPQGDLHEMVLQGAFAPDAVRRAGLWINHRSAESLPGQLMTAESAFGLMFRLTDIPKTELTTATVARIRAGELCKASFQGHGRGTVQRLNGETLFLIDEVKHLTEISLSATACHGGTAVWLSDMPHRPLWPCRETWLTDAEGEDGTDYWIASHPLPAKAKVAQ